MRAIAQADREAVDRRAKGANLVFLNIPEARRPQGQAKGAPDGILRSETR